METAEQPGSWQLWFCTREGLMLKDSLPLMIIMIMIQILKK
jgi:hypothetical protein